MQTDPNKRINQMCRIEQAQNLIALGIATLFMLSYLGL